MDRMGDDPFCSLFIDTMLNNNGPFFKRNFTCKQGVHSHYQAPSLVSKTINKLGNQKQNYDNSKLVRYLAVKGSFTLLWQRQVNYQ